jgi:hypothetical protein
MYRRVLGPVPLDSPSPEEAYEPTLGANERARFPRGPLDPPSLRSQDPEASGKIPLAPGIETRRTAYRHSFYPGDVENEAPAPTQS